VSRRGRKIREVGGRGLLAGLLFAAFWWTASCDEPGEVPSRELAMTLARGMDEIPIHGIREYKNYYGEELASSLEEISTDGKGGFSLRLVERNGFNAEEYEGKFSPADWKREKLKFHQQSRFIYLFRDFRVHDPELFMENYRIHWLENNARIAGRPAKQLEAVSLLSGRRYRVDLDQEWMVPLRVEEFNRRGKTLSEMEFQSIEFNHQVNGTRLPAPRRKATAVDHWREAAEAAGFAPWLPEYLPRGFELIKAELVSYPAEGKKSIFNQYSNGVENFFISARPRDFLVVSSAERDKHLDRDVADGPLARRWSLGPLTVLETVVGDPLHPGQNTFLAIAGKIPPAEISRVLKSLQPQIP